MIKTVNIAALAFYAFSLNASAGCKDTLEQASRKYSESPIAEGEMLSAKGGAFSMNLEYWCKNYFNFGISFKDEMSMAYAISMARLGIQPVREPFIQESSFSRYDPVAKKQIRGKYAFERPDGRYAKNFMEDQCGSFRNAN